MEFRDTESSVNETVTGTVAAAPKSAAAAPKSPAKPRKAKAESRAAATEPKLFSVEVDHSRDALLTDFGKDTLKDRYLLPGESYQDLFVRVASAYADDEAHAQRLYD